MLNEIASIIILSYNKFEYIYSALDSVFMQTYKRIEILVSDDGSISFPKKEIEDYILKKKRSNIISFQVYSNDQNVGTVRNYNNAILRSGGDYIIVLSCDDCFFDEYVVEKVVERLSQSKNGIITCRRLLCDSNLKPIRFMPTNAQIRKIKKMDSAYKQHVAFVNGQFYDLASGSCTYYTKNRLVQDGLFDENYRLLEDWSHFIEITREIEIETAYDIISTKYRSGGVSSSIPKALLDDYIKMMKKEASNHYQEYSRFQRRYLNFNIARFEKNKYLSYLKYPDVFFVKLAYTIKKKRYARQGIREYEKLER